MISVDHSSVITSKCARPLLRALSCSIFSAQALHSIAIITPFKVIKNLEEENKKYKILTLRICKLNKHRRADITFLIPVREIVLGESLVWVVDKRAHVLFVCRVLTVAFNPTLSHSGKNAIKFLVSR